MDLDLSQFIKDSLFEDIRDGDHTSLACIPESANGKAKLLVKEDGILAGVELAKQIFSAVDATLRMEQIKLDGDTIKIGDIAFYVHGSSRSILSAERLVLNCMQRMSGIATSTSKLVKIVEGTKARILDTRKTTPGMRAIEKWAVRIGGGVNHRFGLYDMMMIKDNHIDYAGGVSQAILAARQYLRERSMNLQIEVEARTLDEVDQILKAGGVFRILLDNFSPSAMKDAVNHINGQVQTEASGGITADNIRAYAETGVDYISIGAITHSVKSLDLSLKACK